MKNQITIFIFALFLIANVSFSQNKNPKKAQEFTIPIETIVKNKKIFLSSESDWVTIISYRDWNEPAVENYAGKYEFIQPAQDEDGEFLGDGYNFLTEIIFNSGNMTVLGSGEIEGGFEGVDTLSNKQIVGNKFGKNGMFVDLQYKTRSNEVKNVKGFIEFGDNNKIEYFSELINNNNFNIRNDGKSINVMSFEDKTSLDCIEDYVEINPVEYEGSYYFTHFGTDVYSFIINNNEIDISWSFESLTSKDSTSFKNIRFDNNNVYALDSYGKEFRARFVKLKCDVNSEIWKGFIGLLVNEENLYLMKGD